MSHSSPFPSSLFSVLMTPVEEWNPWLTQDRKAAFSPEPVGEVPFGGGLLSAPWDCVLF